MAGRVYTAITSLDGYIADADGNFDRARSSGWSSGSGSSGPGSRPRRPG